MDEQLFRPDIRTDPSTGIIQPGIPLTVTTTAINSSATCAVLAGAYIDVWHCGATGIDSDESSGRTIHIHLGIRTYNGSATLTNYTTQIFFDDSLSNTVLQNAAYARSTTRNTTNATDMVNTTAGSNNASILATVTQTSTGYAAALTIDLAATAPVSSTPVIATGGIFDAASSAVAIARASWVSIYGTNLAASTYTLMSSDLISGCLPTTLQGVTVTIDWKLAYLDHVSPGQLNVLLPADANTEPFRSSSPTPSVLLLPPRSLCSQFCPACSYRIIMSSRYVFPTAPSAMSSKSTAPASAPRLPPNTVNVKIGGTAATVLWADLTAAGFYRINVTAPTGLTLEITRSSPRLADTVRTALFRVAAS